MEKISVKSGEESYSAVVVEHASGLEQDQYLFTIVRTGQDIDAEEIVIREQAYETI